MTTTLTYFLRATFASMLFLALSAISYGQVRGKVTDHNKTPIEGAYILIPNSGTHVHTDSNGNFEINKIRQGETLVVSHVGYELKTLIVEEINQTLYIALEEKIVALEELLITPSVDAINLLAKVDLRTNPVNSSQEILQKVPGLVLGQHAGGGKAEQIFLRGFDIDHGTDLNITVDGMPVNMVSHAHGQGYADLHFVIPETIDDLNFGLGPYYAQQGNFTTAGYVGFKTKEKLEQNSVKLEVGQFNSQKILGMFQVLDNANHSAYIATEFQLTDGPFESPQNFNRLNIMAKYTGYLKDRDKLMFSASHFTSQWDASGQVPERAVADGTISRFGAIDDTEGGNTSRTNLLLAYTKNINPSTFLKNTLYLSQYDFTLFSNFTFFLNDPINGDQIKQVESRQMAGLTSELNHAFAKGALNGDIQAGVGFRNDQTKNSSLLHTVNRNTTLSETKKGDINETNLFAYFSSTFELGKWTINPAVRFDQFKFGYYDHLLVPYKNQSESAGIVSPKLNVLYNYSNQLQFYVKGGKGFHSNDTRVVVEENGKEILPAAYGGDIGFIWKPFDKLLVNAALWQLYLEQEFVYVGDEGVVEPSGKTNRRGVDFSFRYQPLKWLFWNTDVNYTIARSMDAPEGADYIPLAPLFTVMSSVSVVHPSGIYGSAKLRLLDDRPANEDNSIVAKGYTVVDFNAGYQWKNVALGFSIQNIFNTEWNETQFATESRLQYEVEPVEEIHFTPGTPFFMKASVTYRF